MRKKDGTTRLCVDYRRLNSLTQPGVYPLPRLDDSLDRLHGARFFSTLHLLSGYMQVGLIENDVEKTAFLTQYGLYHFNHLPFQLFNALATLTHLQMDRVPGYMKWSMALVFG